MSNQIIVQNIDFRASYDDIRNHFSQAGIVTDVLIATDCNGASRGIAIISYTNNSDAMKAISKFSNTTFQNRKLFVTIYENHQTFQENKGPNEPKRFHVDKHHEHHESLSSKEYNIQIFQETVDIINSGNYDDSKGRHHDISKMISDSISETVTIAEKVSLEEDLSQQLNLRQNYGPNEKRLIYSRIEVTEESTSAAAIRCKEFTKEVCLLNFANGFEPGGGVLRGCPAQEETLCRQSNLYFCIKDQQEMYKYNRSRKSPFVSHYMIYSPNVVFFRDDDYNFVYPRRVSVITSAAVKCSDLDKNQLKGVYRCMKNRCRKILQLGMKTNNKVLILGAFGCGAFHNNPEDISNIFKELLVDEFYGMFFSKIVFAIKRGKGKNHNYDVFKKKFCYMISFFFIIKKSIFFLLFLTKSV